MKALIVIGLQRDLLAGGPLAVPGGDALIPLAIELQRTFRLTVATQQWHPANHQFFALNHRGRIVGERARIARVEQLLKPVHCVQNTPGAELSPGLLMTRVNKIIRLGTDAEIDDTSAFFDGERRRPTGLSDFLHERKVKSVYLMGQPTELAVLATALDAVELGFKTWVIKDACRAADPNPDIHQQALDAMQEAGVKLVLSDQLGRARPAAAR